MALPPDVWVELFYDNTWHDVSSDVRMSPPVTFSRGLTSESSSEASPMQSEFTLDNRANTYSPRNAKSSALFGKIGRNTPMRGGYNAGGPWAEIIGTSGTNGLSTVPQAAFQTTDLDMRIDVAANNWGVQQGLVSRWVTTGNNRAWGLYIAGTGQLGFVWSPTGTATTITRFSTVPIGGYNGQRQSIRVTLDVNNGAGSYELRFYTGRTVNDSEWTLLGDPLTGAATTLPVSSLAGIDLGRLTGFVMDLLDGKAFGFQVMSTIGGSIGYTMTTADATPGATSFVSNGATWSVVSPTIMSNKHVRVSGEVPEWPPTRDLSGNERTVTVTPTGVTRRMDAGSKPVDSALFTFIKANNPIECWTLTDGPQSTRAASLNGSQSMSVFLGLGATQPQWGGGSLAEWIEPSVKFGVGANGTIRAGLSPNSAANTSWAVDFVRNGTTADAAGTLSITDRGGLQWTLVVTPTSNLILTRFISGVGTTLATVGGMPSDGLPHSYRLSTSVSGGDTTWTLFVDGVNRATGVDSGVAAQALINIGMTWFLSGATSADEWDCGYITYWGITRPGADQFYQAVAGFPGESAGDRVVRLASEGGFTATVSGQEAEQSLIGVQKIDKRLALMNSAARSDFAYLLDCRDRAEVMLRSSSTLWNQEPGLTLNFTDGVISSPFRPRDDDKLTENDITVTRDGGSFFRATLDVGELSVQSPPNGVGRYDKAYTYSLFTDDQAAAVAGLRLHLGTYNGIRYSSITLDLGNPRVFALVDQILRLDVGDKIRLTNLPDDYGPSTVDVLVSGYDEEAGPSAWKITFNCVPAEPWTAFVPGSATYSRVDTAGCVLNEALDTTETGVDVLTTALQRWVDSATYPSDFPFDVIIGGEVMRVTACTGTTLSQTFTVTRSINGVVRSHSPGEAVNILNPVYLTL